MKEYIPILSIAGSDSSGGAGIQADIKTISAIGCYAMTAITAITAQNTTGVKSIQGISSKMVADQIEMATSDIQPLAIKTGMLFNADIINTVADSLNSIDIKNLVCDPVMISTSGSVLLEENAVEAIKNRIFSISTLVTPNQHEAKFLSGGCTDPMDQALSLREMGCRNILIKGGDDGNNFVKKDLLLLNGEDEFITLTADCVNTKNTHGTGCTLSSAIACYLALGFDVEEATMRGKLFITKALRAGAHVAIGRGHGPVNHLFAPRHMKFKKNIIQYGN